MQHFKYDIIVRDGNLIYVDYNGSIYYKNIRSNIEAMSGNPVLHEDISYVTTVTIDTELDTYIFDISSELSNQLSKLDVNIKDDFDIFEIVLEEDIPYLDLDISISRVNIKTTPNISESILYRLIPTTVKVHVIDDVKDKLLQELLNVRLVDFKVDVNNVRYNSLADIYLKYLIGEGILFTGDFTNARLIFEYVVKEYESWMQK